MLAFITNEECVFDEKVLECIMDAYLCEMIHIDVKSGWIFF